MIWRVHSVGGAGASVEMYTAHGDGRIGAWLPSSEFEDEDKDKDTNVTAGRPPQHRSILDESAGERPEAEKEEDDEAEKRKKRKRALIGDLVEGLAKRPMSFS